MILPVQVTFHGLDSSPALRELVEREAAKIDRLYPHIMSCRVAIERAAAHHRTGNPYRVRVEVGIPGGRLVAGDETKARRTLVGGAGQRSSKSLEVHPEHKDPVLAARYAFRKMGRLVEDYARRQRGQVKAHLPSRTLATVVRVFRDADYGFLQADDTREIYFSRASVLDGAFDRLAPGTRVTYAETLGEKGPQATLVRMTVAAANVAEVA